MKKILLFTTILILAFADSFAGWTYLPEDTETKLFSFSRKMVFDSLGNIYISSRYGIFAYENEEWNVYNHSIIKDPKEDPLLHQIKNIRCLGIDTNNVLWAGVKGGIIRYDKENWIYYDTENSSIPYSNGYIYSIHTVDKGAWYAQGPYKYGKISDDTDTLFDIRDYSGDNAIDGGGSVLYYENGPWFYNNDTIFQVKNNEIYYYDSTITGKRGYLHRLRPAREGGFWIDANDMGLIKYSEGKWSQLAIPDTGIFTKGNWEIKAYTEGYNGTMWINALQRLSVNRAYIFKVTSEGWHSIDGCEPCDFIEIAVGPQNRLWCMRYDGIRIYEEEPSDVAPPPPAFTLRPNPARDVLRVDFGLRGGRGRAEVCDLLGRRLIERRLSGEAVMPLDVSSLRPGAYILRIADGGTVRTKIFVVER